MNDRKCFYNGRIYTGNPKLKWAEAIVLEDEKFIYVGNNKVAMEIATDKRKQFDLSNNLVLPGFIDNHTHFLQGGKFLNSIDLSKCKSLDEFVLTIKKFSERNPGKWITGGNWDHQKWSGCQLPDLKLIDDFTQNNPVLVTRTDGHMGLANSLALQFFGIDKFTKSPDDGVIEKDDVSGKLTGILKDSVLFECLKKIPEPDFEERKYYLKSALNEAACNGITSIHDISELKDLELFRYFLENDLLTCHIYSRIPIEEYNELINYKEFLFNNSVSNMFKCGSLKAFADGSLGSQTAWFHDKYLNSDSNGFPMKILSNGDLLELAKKSDSLKYNLSIHAIGDRAIHEVLEIFNKVQFSNPFWDRRFRIEHAQHLNANDLLLMKKLNVFISAQPYHLFEDGEWAEDILGVERSELSYPFNTYLKNEIKLGFGSDWTVAPLNPFLGLYAAITRDTINHRYKNGWNPDEKINLEDAIKCYSFNNAYAEFAEPEKGSISVGRLGDFVVVNEDIFSNEPEVLMEVKVLLTAVNGNIVYES